MFPPPSPEPHVSVDRKRTSEAVGALVPGAHAFAAERTPYQFAAEHTGHYNCCMTGGNWKTISSERRFADRNLEVVIDRVQTPGHPDPRAWTIVHRKPAVVVAPMTRDGKIILIRQERIPIGQAIWEMPS